MDRVGHLAKELRDLDKILKTTGPYLDGYKTRPIGDNKFILRNTKRCNSNDMSIRFVVVRKMNEVYHIYGMVGLNNNDASVRIQYSNGTFSGLYKVTGGWSKTRGVYDSEGDYCFLSSGVLIRGNPVNIDRYPHISNRSVNNHASKLNNFLGKQHNNILKAWTER